MKRKISFLLVLMLVFTFGLIGCAINKIEGIYAEKYEGGVEFITVKDNGTYSICYYSQNSNYELENESDMGTWEKNDKSTYIFNSLGGNKTTFKLQDGKLTYSIYKADGTVHSTSTYEKIDISIEEYIANFKNA